MRASDSTENENTKKMKVQAKTSATAAPPTKAKSYSQVIEPEATTTAASKKSYKEYKPKCDSTSLVDAIFLFLLDLKKRQLGRSKLRGCFFD